MALLLWDDVGYDAGNILPLCGAGRDDMPGRQRTKAREVIALLREFGGLVERFDRLVPRWVDEKRASRFRYADLWREVRAAMFLNGLRLTTLAECLGEDVGMDKAEVRSDDFERLFRSFTKCFDFEALGQLDLLNLPDLPDPFYEGDDGPLSDDELAWIGEDPDEGLSGEPVGAGVSGVAFACVS